MEDPGLKIRPKDPTTNKKKRKKKEREPVYVSDIYSCILKKVKNTSLLINIDLNNILIQHQ